MHVPNPYIIIGHVKPQFLSLSNRMQLGWKLHDCLAVALTFPEYGGGSGQIHYFSCGGDETSLLDCSQDLDVTYCYHYEDVGVICYSDG